MTTLPDPIIFLVNIELSWDVLTNKNTWRFEYKKISK